MIEGKKVILRPLSSKDIEKTVQWRNNMNLKNLILMHPFPVPLELEREYMECQLTSTDNKVVLLGIEDKSNQKLIGYTKLYNIDWIHRTAYFGIVIGDKDARGKGIGKETTQLMIKYAFKNLNLRKILLEVVKNNERAINLYKKIGFETEGILKDQVFIDGSYYSVLIMTSGTKRFNNKN